MDTVGRNEEVIRRYIRNQEAEDRPVPRELLLRRPRAFGRVRCSVIPRSVFRV
jgi:hypothetical protein